MQTLFAYNSGMKKTRHTHARTHAFKARLANAFINEAHMEASHPTATPVNYQSPTQMQLVKGDTCIHSVRGPLQCTLHSQVQHI
eukprot:jgi/Botrbrau1/6765/Bobra.0057s0001.1